jgi:hypothetical protein
MKHRLFILLVFLSFQGFSQSVKIRRSDSLEVMKTDLGQMTWDEAKKACEKLGSDWRLPTIEELETINKYKDRIGGIKGDSYWSSMESNNYVSFSFGFNFGDVSLKHVDKSSTYYVRAVRDVK